MAWDLFRSIRSIRLIRLINKLTGSPHFHAILIFILFFVLYLSTAPRTNVSYADSDLLTTVGYQLGVAHPPGYILYIVLVYVFTHLPIPGTIAFRAHLTSITFHSFSLSFIFLACFKLLQGLGHQASRTKSVRLSVTDKLRPNILNTTYYILAAYAATISLGTSFLYWLYGTVAEKYALGDLFISIIIYLLICITTSKSNSKLNQQNLNPENSPSTKAHPSLLPTSYFLLLSLITGRLKSRLDRQNLESRDRVAPAAGPEIDEQKKLRYHLIVLALITGIGITYHQTFLLILPAIFLTLVLNFSKIRPYWRISLITFLISLLAPIGLLLLINSRSVPISWHFMPTLKGLYIFLSRQELSGYLLIQGRYRGIYLDPVSFTEILHKIPIYLGILLDHFGIISTSLYFLGLFVVITTLYRHIKSSQARHHTTLKSLIFHPIASLKSLAQISSFSLYLILLTITLCTTIFIPMYLDWPADISDQSIRIRQYLAGYPIVAIFISLGLNYLTQQINGYKFRLLSTIYYLLPISFFVFLLAIRLPATYHQLDLKNFSFVHRFYTKQLQDLPPDTIFACIGDTACFASVYAQQIDGLRPDVVIVPHATRIFEAYLNSHPDIKGFDNPENPELYLDYLSWDQGKRPVYVLELQKFYYDLLGMDYGLVTYNPQGYIGEITIKPLQLCATKDQSSAPSTGSTCIHLASSQDYAFSQELINTHFPSSDHTRQQLKASLAQKHLLNAMTYQRFLSTLTQTPSRERKDINLVQTAINQEMNLASQLVADLPPEYQQQVSDVAKLLPTLSFLEYVPGVTSPTRDQILTQADLYLQQKQAYLAVVGVNSILFKNPLDSVARLQLARIYQTTGDTTSARQQLNNILKYDPTNAAVSDLLQQLRP